jgi:FolB domain-containing protein
MAAMAQSDVIALENLVVSGVVGVYPEERHSPQPLRLDLYMELCTQSAAEHERFRETVDYAAIAAQLTFLVGACRFGMLETAAHVLSRYLLLPPALGERRAAIDALRLRITKPLALGGTATPSVEIYRRADALKHVVEDNHFGKVDVVFETREAGIYRLNVAPRGHIPLHVHRVMRESELVLSDGLLCNGAPVAPGSLFHWPKDAAHRYDNPTERWQTILCVDSPPFIESDEVAVEGEPAEVRPELEFVRAMSGAP